MKVIDPYIITKGGNPCELGLRDVDPKGLLIAVEGNHEPVQIKAKPGRSSAAKARAKTLIYRTRRQTNVLRQSLLSEWAKLTPLLCGGDLEVVAVRVERPKKAAK